MMFLSGRLVLFGVFSWPGCPPVRRSSHRLPAGAVFVISAVALAVLALIANRLDSLGWGGKALEYPIWAVLVGLVANGLIRMMGVKSQIYDCDDL